MKKKILSIFVVILCSLSFIGLKFAYTNAQTQEKDNEKHIQHSKLYKEYKTRRKLRDLSKFDPDGVTVRTRTPLGGSDHEARPFNLNDFLTEHLCNADAVVVGTVKDKTSHLTEEETFVFTDYEMTVEQVLKGNYPSVQVGNDISVSRAGGEIILDGKPVETIDGLYKPLEVGKRYLLFLKFIPTTGAFKSADSEGSYQVDGNNIKKLTQGHIAQEVLTSNISSLLSAIRTIPTSNCAAPSIGGAK